MPVTNNPDWEAAWIMSSMPGQSGYYVQTNNYAVSSGKRVRK